MNKEKDGFLNLKECPSKECKAIGQMIRYGRRKRVDGSSVQLIRCNSCKKVMIAGENADPFSTQHKNRVAILEILKELATGRSIRKTAAKCGVSTATVVRTKDNIQKYLAGVLKKAEEETGLTQNQIVEFIQRKGARDKKREEKA